MKKIGRGWSARQTGSVDDEHIISADSRGDIHFLVALQQARVELAIGVYLSLEDVVLNAPLLQIKNVSLQSLDALAHLLLLRERGLEGAL